MSRGRQGGGETEAERDKTKGDERYGGSVRADVGNPGVRRGHPGDGGGVLHGVLRDHGARAPGGGDEDDWEEYDRVGWAGSHRTIDGLTGAFWTLLEGKTKGHAAKGSRGDLPPWPQRKGI